MVRICCNTSMMRNIPFALSITFFSGNLSFFFESLVFTVIGDLSPNAILFALKTCFATATIVIVLLTLLRCGQSILIFSKHARKSRRKAATQYGRRYVPGLVARYRQRESWLLPDQADRVLARELTEVLLWIDAPSSCNYTSTVGQIYSKYPDFRVPSLVCGQKSFRCIPRPAVRMRDVSHECCLPHSLKSAIECE